MAEGNQIIKTLEISQLERLLSNKSLTKEQRECVEKELLVKKSQLKNSGIDEISLKKAQLEKEAENIQREIASLQNRIWEKRVQSLSPEELEVELQRLKNNKTGENDNGYKRCYIEKMQAGNKEISRRETKGDYSNLITHLDMYQGVEEEIQQ